MVIISVAIILRAILFANKQRLTLGVSWHTARKIGVVLGGILLYAVLFVHIGFVLSNFLFLILLLKGVEPYSWRMTILWAGVVTILVYFLFCVALQVEVPMGLLGI
jgi:hypothetical protein